MQVTSGLPSPTRNERVDNCADAELLSRIEHPIGVVRVDDGSVPGRGGDANSGESSSELVRTVGERIRFHRSETDLGETRDGSGQVLPDCVRDAI